MFSDPDKNLAQLGLGEGMKVADLGAGTGFYSIAAARRVGSTGHIYAVEVQKDLLGPLRTAAATAKVHNVETIWGNIERLGGTKLKDGLVDRVVLASVLFQVPEAERDNLALEAKRILKPKGKLLVIDWLPGSPLSPKNCLPRTIAENLFQKNGFAVDKRFDAGDHHYGLVFVRN